MEARAALNKVCKEVGICDSEAILSAPGVKHAAELWKNSSNGKIRRVRLALWSDGTITSCEAELKDEKEIDGSCYTTEPGQEEAFWAFQAHLTSPEVGYKVKSIEVEKGTSPPGIRERVVAGADVR